MALALCVEGKDLLFLQLTSRGHRAEPVASCIHFPAHARREVCPLSNGRCDGTGVFFGHSDPNFVSGYFEYIYGYCGTGQAEKLGKGRCEVRSSSEGIELVCRGPSRSGRNVLQGKVEIRVGYAPESD